MSKAEKESKNKDDEDQSSQPQGKVKIGRAMVELLKVKDFSSITTSDIARESGVNEALIYRYYGDKRGLLHQVLAQSLKRFNQQIELDLKGIKGAVNKLRKLIWRTVYAYNLDRTFSKILLLEVRSFHGYYESSTYDHSRKFGRTLMEIIEEGVENGELRNDISSITMRQAILGVIEHVCLPAIIFKRDMPTDTFTDEICDLLFNGIQKQG